MIFKYFHLGLRQVVMALMNWAIDVPQKLLQSDAKTGLCILFFYKASPPALAHLTFLVPVRGSCISKRMFSPPSFSKALKINV